MRRLQSSTAEMRQGIRIPENGYSETSIQFMDKVMEISGLGDKTFLPDGQSCLLWFRLWRGTTRGSQHLREPLQWGDTAQSVIWSLWASSVPSFFVLATLLHRYMCAWFSPLLGVYQRIRTGV